MLLPDETRMGIKKEQVAEQTPCGTSVTTKFIDEGGEVVRQDVTINVVRGKRLIGRAGLAGMFKRAFDAGIQAGRKTWTE